MKNPIKEKKNESTRKVPRELPTKISLNKKKTSENTWVPDFVKLNHWIKFFYSPWRVFNQIMAKRFMGAAGKIFKSSHEIFQKENRISTHKQFW